MPRVRGIEGNVPTLTKDKKMTDKTTHTPGPWHSRPVGFRGHMEIFTASDDLIAALHLRDGTAANARLIASAPDLLAALVDAVRSLEYAAPIIEAPDNSCYRETIAAARAAIAKATGGE